LYAAAEFPVVGRYAIELQSLLLVKGSRFVIFGASALLLMFANRVFADGAFQRTDDRKKTIVWNNDPQPGDAAEWTGSRDSEGYADGSGTLTWLRTQKQFSTGSNIAGNKKVPISRYTGTMVHGKFVGAVATVDHGTIYHAKFVDGQRKGNWSTSPVVAKATSDEPTAAPEEHKKTSASQPKMAAAEKVQTPAEPKVSEEAEPEPPTEGPEEAVPSEVTGQKSEVSSSTAGTSQSTINSQRSTPLIAQASEADESATPRQQPVTKKAALAPGAVRAIEQPGRQVEKKSEKPKETAQKVKKTPKPEEPQAESAIVDRESESPAEGPSSAIAEKPRPPNPKSTTPAPSQLSTLGSQPSAEESPVDDSIRTLTGPPSSLHTKPAPPATTPAPETSLPTAPTTSAPAATPKLNSVQAMDIADIEARTRGYDLGEYQLPKAEYNAADDTWSVSYIGRDKDKNAKHLGVIVQDKSGKADVKK
jgi:hypothetical protein